MRERVHDSKHVRERAHDSERVRERAHESKLEGEVKTRLACDRDRQTDQVLERERGVEREDQGKGARAKKRLWGKAAGLKGRDRDNTWKKTKH